MKIIILKYFYNSVNIHFFANNKLIHHVLDFTDTEPESESDDEFNEDIK